MPMEGEAIQIHRIERKLNAIQERLEKVERAENRRDARNRPGRNELIQEFEMVLGRHGWRKGVCLGVAEDIVDFLEQTSAADTKDYLGQTYGKGDNS
jgi:hypothetical protein